jgi:hypothetical protein
MNEAKKIWLLQVTSGYQEPFGIGQSPLPNPVIPSH